MNSTTVSGPAQPHDELCRQSQALCACPHKICGTSQALCAPMMNVADSHRLSAPHLITFVERLRLCADPCRNSQALRPPRRPALAPCMLRQSQALRTPMMNCADSLRLCALPLITVADKIGHKIGHQIGHQIGAVPGPRLRAWPRTPLQLPPPPSHAGGGCWMWGFGTAARAATSAALGATKKGGNNKRGKGQQKEK